MKQFGGAINFFFFNSIFSSWGGEGGKKIINKRHFTFPGGFSVVLPVGLTPSEPEFQPGALGGAGGSPWDALPPVEAGEHRNYPGTRLGMWNPKDQNPGG